MNEHTPLPWITPSGPRAGGVAIVTSKQFVYGKPPAPHYITIAEVSGGRTYEEMQANARFIVRACNSHDDLLAALEELPTNPVSLAEAKAAIQFAKNRAVAAKAKLPT